MGLFERLLHKSMASGKPVPAGSHLTSDAGFSRIDVDSPLVFKLPLWTEHDEIIGRYVGIADTTSEFYLNGSRVDVDDFLASYSTQFGPIELEVVEPGVIASMRMCTREPADA